VAALLVVAAAQPLITDDAWWHLALGEAFAREGPWLAADPLLFTAPGPPAPTSWLADVGLYTVHGLAGFRGLRVTAALAVALILALSWRLLRRCSGSPSLASLATACFACLAAYRLVQLRPQLISVLFALFLYALVIAEREDGSPPSRWLVALAVALLGLWANLHAAFLVGPILLSAALAGLVAAHPLRSADERRRDLSRGRRLAATLGLGLLATLLNPSLFEPHLAWFVSGADTPSLLRVADEWLPLDPLRLPHGGLPPSALAWALYWALLLLTPISLAAAVRQPASRASDARQPIDPALMGVAAFALAAPLIAVRFLWLSIFPLLLLACAARRRPARTPAVERSLALAATAFALGLLPAFVQLGDWRFVSSAISTSPARYAMPYRPSKYFARTAWFLDDAALEGRVFNDYFQGGFLGYWLAPEIRAFANGTLNMSSEAIDANLPLRERRGVREGETFEQALDRLGVDLFIGIRLPEPGPPGRPWFYTTAHLESSPGWRLLYRNLYSAVYLRDDARNAANLRRVSAYYRRQGVPFDPQRGFDAAEVVRAAPMWAISKGLVPRDFHALASRTRALDSGERNAALRRIASVYAALGLYDESIRADRRLLRGEPTALDAQRRIVWSLLRLDRLEEARTVAEDLLRRPALDSLSRRVGETALLAASLRPDELSRRVARLPVFSSAEARAVLAGVVEPEPRERRR